MARELSRQFRTHSIAKTYLALVVHGHGGDSEPGLGNGAASGWTGDVADDDGPRAKKTGLITNPLRVDDDGRVSACVRGSFPSSIRKQSFFLLWILLRRKKDCS